MLSVYNTLVNFTEKSPTKVVIKKKKSLFLPDSSLTYKVKYLFAVLLPEQWPAILCSSLA